MMVPGVLFEELGLTYLGPVDGHDLPKLIETFQQADNVTEACIGACRNHQGQGL